MYVMNTPLCYQLKHQHKHVHKMNRKNLIIALAFSGSLASCQKEGTATAASTENKTSTTTSFTDKVWRMKSVITDPAVLDVDGDGKKDSEVISSLQYPERNKDIVFAADGKVWERLAALPGDASTEAKQNGTWKSAGNANTITWTQEDGTASNITTTGAEEMTLVHQNEMVTITVLFYKK